MASLSDPLAGKSCGRLPVVFFVVSQGVQSLSLDFFTHMPRPVGEPGGGMANAIVGTLMLTGLAGLMAVPLGVVSGIYLSEYPGGVHTNAVKSRCAEH